MTTIKTHTSDEREDKEITQAIADLKRVSEQIKIESDAFLKDTEDAAKKVEAFKTTSDAYDLTEMVKILEEGFSEVVKAGVKYSHKPVYENKDK